MHGAGLDRLSVGVPDSGRVPTGQPAGAGDGGLRFECGGALTNRRSRVALGTTTIDGAGTTNDGD